jgi:hypothetical protein
MDRLRLARHAVPLALGVAALGLALRVHRIGEFWPNPDEGLYFSIAVWQDWGRAWAQLAANAHPPLYHLLLRAAQVVTLDVAWLRGLSAALGAATVFGCFGVVRRLSGPAAGLAAAGLAAAAPGLVIHSQLLRPYPLQLALLVFALWELVRWLDDGRRRDLAGFALLTLAAVLTQYASLAVAAGALAFALVGAATGRAPWRRALGVGLAAGPALAAGALLYAFHLRPQVVGSVLQEVAVFQLREYLYDGPRGVWAGFVGVHRYVFGPSCDGVAALLCLVGLASFARRRPDFAALAAAVLAAGAALALAGRYPFGANRHSLYQIVAVVPCVAEALRLLLARSPLVAAGAAAVVAAGLFVPGPLRAALGVPAQTIAVERIARRDVVERHLAELEAARERPHVVFLDEQTALMLMPILHAARDEGETRGDPAVQRLRWGASAVLLAPAWVLRAHPRLVEQPDHVLGFLRHAARTFPELRLPARHDGLLLFGGWGAFYYAELPSLDARLGGGCFAVPKRDPGFGSARVDFARCLAPGPR